MNYSLTVNGLDNAFPKEFGCDCPRCMRPERAANTSMSLIGTQVDDTQTAFHALIDCGHGISDSLTANPLLRGDRARLDWLLLTHWHADHNNELGRIGAGWMRTCARRTSARCGQPFERVRTWCREGSAQWLTHEHDNAWRTFVDPVIDPGFADAGTPLVPVPLAQPDLHITPIALHHSSADIAHDNPARRQPSCAGFVIQTATRKAVLFWDMDNTNTWITRATERSPYSRQFNWPAMRMCSASIAIRGAMRSSPAGKPASHASFHTQLPFVRALAPRETLLMHLSGHEDDRGDGFGWLDAEWQITSPERCLDSCTHMPGRVRVPDNR